MLLRTPYILTSAGISSDLPTEEILGYTLVPPCVGMDEKLMASLNLLASS